MTLRQRVAIGGENGLGHHVGGKAGTDPLAQAQDRCLDRMLVLQGLSDGARQRRGIAGRNESGGLRSKNFRNSADAGRNERNARGRSLEHDIGQGFRTRGHDQEPPERIWSSRQHALITFEDGLLAIEDLNSTNGTFVNRLRVHPGQKRPLQVNDVIQIGTVQLKVKV